VLSGPRFSPLALLVTRGVTPHLAVPEKLVPGPPKRFAQGIGATLSVAAVVALLGFDASPTAAVLVAMIVGAATLESVLGFCIGCKLFALLMQIGVIPERVCRECNELVLEA
jgi:hypothetical protein